MSKLEQLVKKWRETTFYWGNDLGKVKTQAYRECADELELVIAEIRVVSNSKVSR